MSGRVYLSNGDIVYSPNCSLDVNIPERPDNSSNIFHATPSPRLSDFHQPRWWTPTFGYMAFLPLKPSFTGYPFDRLDHIPPIEKSEGGFHLPGVFVDRWMRLQKLLGYCACLLTLRYKATQIRPFYPSGWGFHGVFRSPGTVRRRAMLSRDWFVIWMTALSYLVAIGDECGSDGIPDWFSALVEASIPQIWVAGVSTSIVSNFSPFVPRVGLFVELVDTEKN
jgi:hypothetical protein